MKPIFLEKGLIKADQDTHKDCTKIPNDGKFLPETGLNLSEFLEISFKDTKEFQMNLLSYIFICIYLSFPTLCRDELSFE